VAAVSFFGDAQESPALVFPELHVETLALNLQFSRLDNVIHFFPEAADFTAVIYLPQSGVCTSNGEGKGAAGGKFCKKSCGFCFPSAN
jgi:hypothetical protein